MIVEGDDEMDNRGMMGWECCLPVAALVSRLGGTSPPLSPL